MTYVVVTIKKIIDLEAFREYAVVAQPLVERHGGKYVAVDKSPEEAGIDMDPRKSGA